MCRTLFAGLVMVAVAAPAAAQPIPESPRHTLPAPVAVAAARPGVFQPVGNTRALPTTESRQYWAAMYGLYQMTEAAVRYLSREAFTPAVRLIKAGFIDRPKTPDQWLDAALWAASPWLGKPAADADRGGPTSQRR